MAYVTQASVTLDSVTMIQPHITEIYCYSSSNHEAPFHNTQSPKLLVKQTNKHTNQCMHTRSTTNSCVSPSLGCLEGTTRDTSPWLPNILLSACHLELFEIYQFSAFSLSSIEPRFPVQLRSMCHCLYQVVSHRFPEGAVAALGTVLFLRFINPSLGECRSMQAELFLPTVNTKVRVFSRKF